MKYIVNADDCGINQETNCLIKEYIEKGKLSSTTIMANMDDIEGALCLYEQYHQHVSFGVHLNLTEGFPLLGSHKLVKYGYYSIKDGKPCFDLKRAYSFSKKFLPDEIKKAIYDELAAQISILRADGVKLSHIDSHHHIHTSPSLMGVIAQLSKDFNIPKVRRMRNYVPIGLSYFARQCWCLLSRAYNRNYVFTNYFGSVYEFINNQNLIAFKENESIELMCHPGNKGTDFQREMESLNRYTFPKNMEMISYNEL